MRDLRFGVATSTNCLSRMNSDFNVFAFEERYCSNPVLLNSLCCTSTKENCIMQMTITKKPNKTHLIFFAMNINQSNKIFSKGLIYVSWFYQLIFKLRKIRHNPLPYKLSLQPTHEKVNPSRA